MCVIIYKPKNIDLPTESIIKTCWNHNPDGAGIAIMAGHTVTIDKGFMALEDYLDFVTSAVKPEQAACYHFRIATSGGITPQACHPFPVSNRVKDLRALHVTTDRAFIHNGIISSGSPDLSDTQLYIRDILSKYISKGMSTETRQKRIAKETKGSRTALMDATLGQVYLTGDWLTDEKTGLLFSNSSYQPSPYDWYDDDIDYKALEVLGDVCPDCHAIGRLISPHWSLYECPKCHTVFNELGEVFLDGDSYDY